MPLSIRFSLCPRRLIGSHCRTRLGSTLSLSHQGSACLLAESRARTAQQGMDPQFASLLHAQRFSFPSRGLAPQDKAWVYALTLSIRFGVSPRRVAGSHRKRRLGSTLCLSPPSSALLIAKSWARTAGQGLGLRFASLHQGQQVSSPSRELAPHNKAWVHVLPFSTRLSESPCHVGVSHRATRLGSALPLST